MGTGEAELMYMLRQFLTRLIEAERRVAGQEIRGKVKGVDVAKKRARIVIGKDEDGEDVLSPWLPYEQINGALKFHQPPVDGQTMRMSSASGDLEQGMLSPATWSDDNPSPSDDAEVNVMTFGSIKVQVQKDNIIIDLGEGVTLNAGNGLTINAGGTKFVLDGTGFVQTGGKQEHDGRNVGVDHVHTKVLEGGQLSGPPPG